jgi:hypothetical protein
MAVYYCRITNYNNSFLKTGQLEYIQIHGICHELLGKSGMEPEMASAIRRQGLSAGLDGWLRMLLKDQAFRRRRTDLAR